MLEHVVRAPDKRTKNTPLLLQHCAWHGAWCWENWLDHFASLGVLVTGLFRVADPKKVEGTPMLVVAGGKDAIFTVEEEKETAAAYGAELRLFADQAHNLMAEPRWREVADTIDVWLSDLDRELRA